MRGEGEESGRVTVISFPFSKRHYTVWRGEEEREKTRRSRPLLLLLLPRLRLLPRLLLLREKTDKELFSFLGTANRRYADAAKKR